MKKITKALLLCAFCLGIFWAGTEQVQAAETDSGSCGDSATWSYDGDMKTLTFLGSGEVVLGGWYEYTGEIEVVYITKEITSIKETAFHTMSIDTLQYFLVEDGNSNFATSAGVLFNRNYTKLLFYPTGRAGEYSIPSTVTEIGSYAFSHCQWLTSITSYGNIKKIGEYAFYGCHELTNAPIKEGIEEIGQSAFSYCYSLTAVTIPESVKSLGSYAFDTCLSYNDYYPGLQNVRILGSNTQMGKYVFAWCKELVYVESASDIGASAFDECTSLTTVVLKDGVTTIGSYAFNECSNLKELQLPESLETIERLAFEQSGIREIHLPVNVKTINGVLWWSDIEKITVDAKNPYFTVVDDVLFNKDMTELLKYSRRKTGESYYIPEGITEIGSDAFYGCKDLKEIKIPKGVTEIGYRTFDGCSSLEKLVLPDGVLSFGGCSFEKCSALDYVVMPRSVTTIVYGDYLGYFKDCKDTLKVYSYGGTEAEKKFSSRLAILDEGITLTLNPNGGSCSTKSMKVYPAYTYGTLPTPTRSGYDFAGWYTAASGGEQITGNSIVEEVTDYSVYAHWTPKGYRVTYDANGGTVSPAYKDIAYGENYGTLPTPTRTGYDFTGWYTAKTGGTKVTSANKVTQVSNHKLYAHWTPKGYRITYDANGGTVSPTYKDIAYGENYGTLPTATRTGYDFTGWYTAKTGGTKVTSANKVTNASNHKLYAQWEKKTYTVTFNANGGSSLSKSSVKVKYDTAIGTLPTVKRSGYTLQGWYTAKSGGTKVTKAIKIKENQTLYAQWKVNPPSNTTIKVKTKSSNAVTISWKKVSGAKGYQIYRATSAKGKYKLCKTISKGSTTSYVNSKLTGGKTYYYKVRAYKVSGKKKVYGTFSKAVKKKVYGALKTPKLKIKMNKEKKTFTLSWNTVKNAQKIELYQRIDDNTWKKKAVLAVSKGKTVSYSYEKMSKGHEYRYRIRAYYEVDGKKIYSEYSNVPGFGYGM